jgi:hypothetical protein
MSSTPIGSIAFGSGDTRPTCPKTSFDHGDNMTICRANETSIMAFDPRSMYWWLPGDQWGRDLAAVWEDHPELSAQERLGLFLAQHDLHLACATCDETPIWMLPSKIYDLWNDNTTEEGYSWCGDCGEPFEAEEPGQPYCTNCEQPSYQYASPMDYLRDTKMWERVLPPAW